MRACLLLAVLLVAASAHAHKPSDSYLSLRVEGAQVQGRWDIALRDLEHAYGLDLDGNGELTWGEVRTKGPALQAYALERLQVGADGVPCSVTGAPAAQRIVRHSDGAYVVLGFTLTCGQVPRTLDVDYGLLFAEDPQHRGLARITGEGGVPTPVVFSAGERTRRVVLADGGPAGQLTAMVHQGAFHIWEGLDHLLFLVALLLPCVLRRDAGGWAPRAGFGPVLADVLKIVTAFTVAHSLTLSLAALDVVRLPVRWVEAGVALSVVVAALNNVRPFLRELRWVAAFALGLLHGFAFSETLVDLGLSGGSLVRTLLGFNVGVELGQLGVVALFLPLAYAVRASVLYRRVLLVGGSALIVLLASVWFVERAFVLRILAI
jgi:HupE / UreJ protein